VACNFKKFLSPIKYWNKNKTNILKKISKKDIHRLREYLYENTKLCNNFRITVSLAILQMFKPKKWLDISAGWGDRLIASIALLNTNNINCYIGIDPNKELMPCYQNIINDLCNPLLTKNINIINEPFEDANITLKTYDFVFWSPPFFDFEIYSNSYTQSIFKFKDYEDWEDNFLIFCIKKMVKSLAKDGVFILYIDYVNINSIIKKIVNSTNLSIKNTLYYKSYKNKLRPYYIFYNL
jgi:tRNA1(Val) A37 N6-methylase TrmN6